MPARHSLHTQNSAAQGLSAPRDTAAQEPATDPEPRGIPGIRQHQIPGIGRPAAPSPASLVSTQAFQLQRTLGNRMVGKLLGRQTRHRGDLPGGVAHPGTPAAIPTANLNRIQRWPWKAGPDQELFNHRPYLGEFTGYVCKEVVPLLHPSKTAAIAAIADLIAQANIPDKNRFIKWQTLRKTYKVKVSGTIPHTLQGQQLAQYQKPANVDPFLIQVSARYGVLGNEKTIKLTYEFSDSSHGYVQWIEQEGEKFQMHGERGEKALPEEQAAKLQTSNYSVDDPLFKMFGSAHEKDNSEKISDVAEMPTGSAVLQLIGPEWLKNTSAQGIAIAQLHNRQELAKRSKRLDAITKLAAEGARWAAVREQTRTGKLTNTSRFYTKQDPNSLDPAAPVYYVTFVYLWGHWDKPFDSKFNISNAVLAQKLRDERVAWQPQADKTLADMQDTDKQVP